MWRICSIIALTFALVVTNTNASPVQSNPKPEDKIRKGLIRRIMQAQRKGRILQVRLKEGSLKRGYAFDVSPTDFSLSEGGRFYSLLRYDQVKSVSNQSGWAKFIRMVRDVVTLPILIPLVTISALHGNRC